jgi:hypothetical protein
MKLVIMAAIVLGIGATVALLLGGCGTHPKVACDAYVADAGVNIGGVTDSSCAAGEER